MAIESARKFAKDFYENDEIIKELYKMRVLKTAVNYNKNAPEG